jgi:hypothetical protein
MIQTLQCNSDKFQECKSVKDKIKDKFYTIPNVSDHEGIKNGIK